MFNTTISQARSFKPALLFVTAALLSVTSAWAETPIDERHPLDADGQLHVSNVCGLIEVSVWSRNEVQISGTLGDGVDKLDVSGNKNKLEVLVRNPNKRRDVGDTTLTIKVPANAQLQLDGVSSDIVVNGSRGAVTAATVSGDVRLKLESARLEARTVSGDIEVQAPSRDSKLNTVSGDITARGLSGKLALETVSGDAEVAGAAAFSELKLKSISGDLELDGEFTNDARISGETLSGDLRMRVPASVSAALNVNTFSGSFNNRIAGAVATSGSKGKREIRLGDGKARVDLSSFSGDVTIENR
jgi:DUF4097 and DUF4098 domain-containing protein YvlB